MITYTYNAYLLCSMYKCLLCSTNLQILDSIWVVKAQMFCMLQPTIYIFVIVDEPKYTRNTSVYCVTDYGYTTNILVAVK